jgi:hypothetical protein
MESMLKNALRKHHALRNQLENMLLGDDSDEVERQLKNFVAKRPCWVPRPLTTMLAAQDIKPKELLTFGSHLQLIPGAESLLIPAGNDERCIAERSGLFAGSIDPDFKSYKLVLKQQSTVDIKVQVLELVKDGKFADIYAIPNRSYDILCFTQAHITLFVEKHKKWLRTGGYGTFFLFKEKVEGKDKFFVADVSFDDHGQLYVYVNDLSFDYVWYAEYRDRFVFPQLPLEPLQPFAQ